MTRQRVALLSHVGYDAYRHDDGSPFFHPDEFDITLLARPRDIALLTPGQVSRCISVDIPLSGELAASLPALVGDFEFDWVVATQERLLLPPRTCARPLALAAWEPGTRCCSATR